MKVEIQPTLSPDVSALMRGSVVPEARDFRVTMHADDETATGYVDSIDLVLSARSADGTWTPLMEIPLTVRDLKAAIAAIAICNQTET